MPSEAVKSQLKRLPAKPGVYLFRDARGDVLYVGKAKSLRPRVRQYFQAGRSDNRHGHRPARRPGRRRSRRSSPQTEVEALHLEQNLVKRHRPPFNVRLRDDKSFPYIAVTRRGRVPARDVHARAPPARRRLLRPVREREEGARDARRAEPRLPLPAVRGAEARAGTAGIPCLDYHIERCLAPCVGYVSKEDYRDADRQRDRVPLGRRPADPRRARAADARGRGRASASRTPRATATGCTRSSGWPSARRSSARSIGTIDVIGVAVGAERAAVQVFPLRDGRMVDRYSFHLENAAGEDVGRGARGVLPRVLRLGAVDPAADPRAARRSATRRALEAFLSELRGSRVEVRAPERGEKRRLQELAQQNAELALASETFVAETKRLRRVEALEELREVLNLESLPIRIECFDISNIQGQEIVGSMVVFEDGVAKKAHYRKFARPRAGRAGRLRRDGRGRVAPLRAARRRARRPTTTTSRSPRRRTSS